MKEISCYVKPLIDGGEKIDKAQVKFVENSLFTTLTNVNFDPKVHVKLLKESQEIKECLRKEATARVYPSAATNNLSDTKDEMLKDSVKAGIMFDQTLNEDIRSLRSTILFGLKGISAYGHQARFIGYNSDEIDNFYFIGLQALTDDSLTLQDLINLSMKVGEMSVQVMKTLNEANTSTYKNPSQQKVNVNIKKCLFIIISGHDLRDLEILLQQTEGKGINIYTHGEVLPSHGYPELKSTST